MPTQFRNAELIRLLRPEFLSGVSSSGAAVKEGAGIDLTLVSTVGLGGDSTLLYDSGGAPVTEFLATDAGLQAAVAEAASGDTILLPSLTIASAGLTLPDGVALIGMFGFKSKLALTGSVALTGSNLVKDLWLDLTANDANNIMGVTDGGTGNELIHCRVIATQAGAGNAYAIGMIHSGTLTCRDCYLEGAVSGAGVGYAGYHLTGNLYVIGGEVKGSVANEPFNVT